MENYLMPEPLQVPILYEPVKFSEPLINYNPYLNPTFRESLKSSYEPLIPKDPDFPYLP
jgi:hypothetical protein